MVVESAWLREVRVPITRQPAAARALLSLVAAKHMPTYRHMTRVAAYAHLLSTQVKLNRRETRQVTLAALLHDVGKLVILDEILTKPARLTDQETHIMSSHAEASARIVSRTETLADLAEVVRHHHEWWNGKGYPIGLVENAIPLGSRIIAVVDAFDTMTTPRPYADPRPIEESLLELERSAGTQFDPDLAHTFVKLIREGAMQEMLTGVGTPSDARRPEPLALRLKE